MLNPGTNARKSPVLFFVRGRDEQNGLEAVLVRLDMSYRSVLNCIQLYTGIGWGLFAIRLLIIDRGKGTLVCDRGRRLKSGLRPRSTIEIVDQRGCVAIDSCAESGWVRKHLQPNKDEEKSTKEWIHRVK